MTRMHFNLLICYIVWAMTYGAVLPAQAPNREVSSPTIPKNTSANPELLRLVIADQWDRGNDMFGKGQVRASSDLDWKATTRRDVERHEAVRSLLADGKLKTKEDFSYASIIFQHSSDPADLMLAHVLSSTAYGMGGADRWMMAATMDRYLQSIKQPQIFGTQFRTNDGGHTWTMEPYNRDTVTDAERALWCVIPLEQQEKVLQQYQKGNPRSSTEIEGCK
jgi:hypothetical protein